MQIYYSFQRDCLMLQTWTQIISSALIVDTLSMYNILFYLILEPHFFLHFDIVDGKNMDGICEGGRNVTSHKRES